MKISAYAASLAVVLCLAVAGCSDDDEPGGSSPTEKPSPTATATDSPPAPPALPAAARKKTAAGAEAFVKYYWAVVDYSERNGTTELLQTLQTDGCTGCDRGVEQLQRVFTQGAVFTQVNAEIETRPSRLLRSGGVPLVVVTTELHYKGGVKKYTDGTDREVRQEPYDATLKIIPIWERGGSGWLIHQLEPAQ